MAIKNITIARKCPTFPVYRGDVFYYDFGKQEGSLQSGLRPVIVVQNNKGNKYSTTVLVSPITSTAKLKYQPTHVYITPDCVDFIHGNLIKDSIILFEQIFTVEKSDLQDKVCSINLDKYIFKRALKVSVGL